ncbi:cystatin 9 [Rhinolophus ferrumequinum]|uniref:Cystatin 9 n=1 Tax=Rhinolophus ferrumequinum TaxID=59479 RepID=A0A671ESY4_RHIFE|nr:cystatin-9-like [Rhinolophus ferrumequinum]KAF6284221.1 cystatin 9 [Rhinolophus ferrumequinum]
MGARLPAALLHWQGKRALPWAMLLLLVPGTPCSCWSSHRERENDDQNVMESYFPATVEYALHMFNLKSKDMNAYRLVRIRSSRREQVETMLAFSMELELRRTKCGKFDEDIDNCSFQESPEMSNTFTCFFTIGTEPWRTVFQLLNKTCLEGFH